tara:strand:- start:252 stop:443 length:192 start_codon:yes stop_codon:yes gene_type:complete
LVRARSLDNNNLTNHRYGDDKDNRLTYNAEGINALCEALIGNSTLTSLEYASQLESLPTVNSL